MATTAVPSASNYKDATPEQLEEAFRTTREYFRSGATRSYKWRVSQIEAVKKLLIENKDAVSAAVYTDLRRPKYEAELAETISVIGELDFMLANLKQWMAPEHVKTPLLQKPATSKLIKDPKGVVLVLGAWNFPILLSILPMATAICAGNTVVLKPSEVSPASAALIAQLVPKYLDSRAARVVLGGVAQSTALLDMPFNHIFYTGGSQVGSVVMTAAAKRLTPVTLELGGKSPAIVAADANMAVTARRILNGKFLNCGQVCIAPDYVLVESSAEGKLIAALKDTLNQFFGPDPQSSASLGRIVNRRHFDRLNGLLTSHRGEVVVGGNSDVGELYIAPTIIRGVDTNSPIMKEEIFGPILPIVAVRSIDDAIEFVNDRPQPLALYVFTSSSKTSERVLNSTTSGGACVNDTVMHSVNPFMPFGGVGPSGLGSYHGKFGFDTFSHTKAVLTAPTWSDPAIRYPPYSDKALRIVSWLAIGKMPYAKPALVALAAAAIWFAAKKYKVL